MTLGCDMGNCNIRTMLDESIHEYTRPIALDML